MDFLEELHGRLRAYLNLIRTFPSGIDQSVSQFKAMVVAIQVMHAIALVRYGKNLNDDEQLRIVFGDIAKNELSDTEKLLAGFTAKASNWMIALEVMKPGNPKATPAEIKVDVDETMSILEIDDWDHRHLSAAATELLKMTAQ